MYNDELKQNNNYNFYNSSKNCLKKLETIEKQKIVYHYTYI